MKSAALRYQQHHSRERERESEKSGRKWTDPKTPHNVWLSFLPTFSWVNFYEKFDIRVQIMGSHSWKDYQLSCYLKGCMHTYSLPPCPLRTSPLIHWASNRHIQHHQKAMHFTSTFVQLESQQQTLGWCSYPRNAQASPLPKKQQRIQRAIPSVWLRWYGHFFE